MRVFPPFSCGFEYGEKAKKHPTAKAWMFSFFIWNYASYLLMTAIPMGVGPVWTPMVQPI